MYIYMYIYLHTSGRHVATESTLEFSLNERSRLAYTYEHIYLYIYACIYICIFMFYIYVYKCPWAPAMALHTAKIKVG